MTFTYFRDEDFLNAPELLKVVLIFGLPLLSYWVLSNNQLETTDCKKKYGTLYENMHECQVACYMTTLFCCKRILLASTTIFIPHFIHATICVQILSSLFSLGLNLNKRPMKTKVLNLIENMNEGAVYLSCLFMLLFTDWLPDIELRYSLGYVFLPVFLFIILFNLGFVFHEMFLAFLRSKWVAKRSNSLNKKIEQIKANQRAKAGQIKTIGVQ